MNDEKIIKSIINRDEVAVNEVIVKYSKLLWKVAGTVLNNIGTHQDVEECVADTFIYLWENPTKFDPQRGKLRTWLCVIARTQAVNRCREIAKRNTVSLEEAAWATYVGVIDGVLKEEARKTLFAAINALGELEREILIRRYYYEQKPKEIAVALDMSVKQIDNHLYQAKRKLRSVIAV